MRPCSGSTTSGGNGRRTARSSTSCEHNTSTAPNTSTAGGPMRERPTRRRRSTARSGTRCSKRSARQRSICATATSSATRSCGSSSGTSTSKSCGWTRDLAERRPPAVCYEARHVIARSAAVVAFVITAACAPTAPGGTSAPPAAVVTATASVTSVLPQPSPAPNPQAVPPIPAPIAVTLDARTTALAVLDINSMSCGPRPPWVDSLPTIQDLLKKARDAKVQVVYGTTSNAGVTILPQVAPQDGEPVVQ